MAADGRQVTTVVQRLGAALAQLNPLRLGSTVRRVIDETATPPPGDADRLRALAEAFRAAASDLRDASRRLRAAEFDRDRLVRGAAGAGSGAVVTAGPVVAASAGQVLAAASGSVDATASAFDAAATELDRLASRVADHQRRHGELRARLNAAAHGATHVGRLPIPNPAKLDDLAAVVRECRDLYTEALATADEAASAFTDLAGRARVAAGVGGGLDPCDAAVVAGLRVEIRGIGDAFDEGVLTPAQLGRLGRRLAAMSPQDADATQTLLDRAGSDTERGYLLKALAAGHPMDAVGAFAETIRGRDDGWLHSHLSLIDRGGAGEQDRFGFEVDQYDPYTCGTTSLIVARAEADPLYALSVTDGDPAGFDARLSAEQDRVHDATNLIYPERWGTSPEGMADWLTQHCGPTGVCYRWQLLDDTDRRAASRTLREVVAAVNAGHPVPVLVGGAVPRHYVLAVGHAGADLLVFEPTAGATVRVPAADFVAGTLAGSLGFDHVQAVVLPTDSSR